MNTAVYVLDGKARVNGISLRGRLLEVSTVIPPLVGLKKGHLETYLDDLNRAKIAYNHSVTCEKDEITQYNLLRTVNMIENAFEEYAGAILEVHSQQQTRITPR